MRQAQAMPPCSPGSGTMPNGQEKKSARNPRGLKLRSSRISRGELRPCATGTYGDKRLRSLCCSSYCGRQPLRRAGPASHWSLATSARRRALNATFEGKTQGLFLQFLAPPPRPPRSSSGRNASSECARHVTYGMFIRTIRRRNGSTLRHAQRVATPLEQRL